MRRCLRQSWPSVVRILGPQRSSTLRGGERASEHFNGLCRSDVKTPNALAVEPSRLGKGFLVVVHNIDGFGIASEDRDLRGPKRWYDEDGAVGVAVELVLELPDVLSLKVEAPMEWKQGAGEK